MRACERQHSDFRLSHAWFSCTVAETTRRSLLATLLTLHCICACDVERRALAGDAALRDREDPAFELHLRPPRLGALIPSPVLDTRFGHSGGAFAIEFARRATLLANGKVLLCDGPRVVRLTPEGRADATFGAGGAARFPHADLTCIDLLPLPSGEAFVIVGAAATVGGTRIMRASANGELSDVVANRRDLGVVASDGDARLIALHQTAEHEVLLDAIAPASTPVRLDIERKDWALQLAWIGDRPMVWPVYFFGGEPPDHVLMRFLSAGDRDTTFARGGAFRLPRHCGALQGVLGLRDGRLLIASSGCVALTDENGHVDPRFGQKGIVEVGSDGAPAQLPDGRIVLPRAGQLVTIGPSGQLAVTKLVQGPVVSTRIGGVDSGGRVLVIVGLHRYVTERATDQETLVVMTRP